MQFQQLTQGLGPAGAIAVKTNELIDYIGDKLGVPSSVRTSAPERAYMLEQQMNEERMRQAAQLQMAQAGAMQEAPAPQEAPLPIEGA